MFSRSRLAIIHQAEPATVINVHVQLMFCCVYEQNRTEVVFQEFDFQDGTTPIGQLYYVVYVYNENKTGEKK